MQPFHNKGWDYLPQMESIIPVLGAKGHFAFAAGTMSSAQIITDQLYSDDNEDCPMPLSKAVRSSKAGAVGNVDDVNDDGKWIIKDLMDIHQDPTMDDSVSSSSKWKHTFVDTGTQLLSSSHAMSTLIYYHRDKPYNNNYNKIKKMMQVTLSFAVSK